MPPRKPRPKSSPKAGGGSAREPGPPRLLLAAGLRLGAVPAGLPALPESLRPVATGASVAAWEALVRRAVKAADGVILTGRVLDAAADVRAERALRVGLDRLAEAGVPAFAHTAEPLPVGLAVTVLDPAAPAEVELSCGGAALAAVRCLAGPAAFPVPDGLPVVGLLSEGAGDDGGGADAGAGCDLLIPHDGPRRAVRGDDAVVHHPGFLVDGGTASLVTLPATAGASGAAVKEVFPNPVRFLALSADLPEEPADLPAELRRRAGEQAARGERLRIVDWTLHVGRWGDRLLDPAGADDLAAALNGTAPGGGDGPATRHRVVAVPHEDRLVGDDGTDGDGGNGDAGAFLEALSHFDPLADADPLPPELAVVAADPARVRRLAARFALPLADAD